MARPRDRAGREVLVEVQRHEREHAVGDRHVEVRAVAGRARGDERGEDRDHRVHAAAGAVADGRAGQRRAAVGVAAGAVEVAADREVVEVVAGPLRVRAVLAVAGGRAVDDAGVHRVHRLVADAEPVDDAGPEALDHDVGASPRGAGTRRGRPSALRSNSARCMSR